jgi:hypothetical protein
MLSCGRNVFEELGRGYTLIALTHDPATATAFGDAADAMAMPLRVLTDTPDGGRGAYQCRYMLIRPDQHVAWASNQPPADPAEVLRKTAGRAKR